jgi:hypothetical protein
MKRRPFCSFLEKSLWIGSVWSFVSVITSVRICVLNNTTQNSIEITIISNIVVVVVVVVVVDYSSSLRFENCHIHWICVCVLWNLLFSKFTCSKCVLSNYDVVVHTTHINGSWSGVIFERTSWFYTLI